MSTPLFTSLTDSTSDQIGSLEIACAYNMYSPGFVADIELVPTFETKSVELLPMLAPGPKPKPSEILEGDRIQFTCSNSG
jgi:hypothetical protein